MQQESSPLRQTSFVVGGLPAPVYTRELGTKPSQAGAGVLSTSQVCAPAPSAPHAAVLLQFTADMHLARTREPLLRKAGFNVTSLFCHEVLDASWMENVSAVLFCQTVKQAEALRLFYLLHTVAGHAKSMRLCRQPAHEADVYSRVLESPVAPGLLVHETMKLRESVWQGDKLDA